QLNSAAASFIAVTRACVIDQDAAHRLGRGAEEMSTPLPGYAPLVDQPQVGFVHQCGSLERVSGMFPAEIRTRQTPQFLLDERSELVERSPVAVVPGQQQFGDVFCRTSHGTDLGNSLHPAVAALAGLHSDVAMNCEVQDETVRSGQPESERAGGILPQ